MPSAEYQREWRKKNPGKHLEYKKNYVTKHPEKAREIKRKASKTPKARLRKSWQVKSRKAQQRAERMGRPAERICYRKLYKEKPHLCSYCGDSLGDDDLILDVDHIVPLGKGGSHTLANVQILHMWCHRRKTYAEWGEDKGESEIALPEPFKSKSEPL